MVYCVGDILYVVFENDFVLLQVLVIWYGDIVVVVVLYDCELCLLSKGVLCELVRFGGSEVLKGLLKVSQKCELDVYLYGLDLLDVLQDYVMLDDVLLVWLCELLLSWLLCVYFIVLYLCDDQLSLCVCEVCYILCGCECFGIVIGSLLYGGDYVCVYCCFNFGFYLFDIGQVLLLLVGIGIGIVLLMGLMQ